MKNTQKYIKFQNSTIGQYVGEFTEEQLLNGTYIDVISETLSNHGYEWSNIKEIDGLYCIYGCSMKEVLSTFQPKAILSSRYPETMKKFGRVW